MKLGRLATTEGS